MKCNWRHIFQCTTVRSYADHMTNYSDLISGYSRLMPNYSDLTSGYSRPILIPHLAKRMIDCRQNHHDCSKINYGCFEMLSWPHRTSANIINKCFWLLETCTKYSYFLEENIRPGAQRLAFEVKYEYIVRKPRIYRGPAFCAWASFQTSGNWCVKNDLFLLILTIK